MFPQIKNIIGNQTIVETWRATSDWLNFVTLCKTSHAISLRLGFGEIEDTH